MNNPKTHTGDLKAKPGIVYDCEEITGYLYASGADTKTAFPKLTTIGGHLYASGADTKTAFPKLTTITGHLYASGADTKTAFPKLTTIGGHLYASGADTKTAFPKLTTIGGSLDAIQGLDTKTAFPKLTTIGGYLDARGADTKTAFPKLTTIGSHLDVRGADTKTVFPKLTTIGGYLYAGGADTKTAFPKLTTIGGSLDAIQGLDTKTAFPKLTTIGGYLDARGADTKTAFPKLTTIGGYLDASGADTKTAFPKLKNSNSGEVALKMCHTALAVALALNGLMMDDGILVRVISARGGVQRVQIIGQTMISYIVKREGKTAHGATLAEARADLLLKLGDRDTAPYKAWTPETTASVQDMIVAYRAITGACNAGVSHFLNGKNYKGKVSVGFVIEETKGKYGHEAFRAFFMRGKTHSG